MINLYADNHGTRACAMINNIGKWESKSCSEFGGHICKLEALVDPETHAEGTCHIITLTF